MAAHDYIYYHDDQDPASGYRRRVVIIPVGNTDLFPAGPDPGWMEDPVEGSGWQRCPQGAFTFGEPEECGYNADGVPVSFPDTSVMKVTIHKHIAQGNPDLIEVLDNYTAAITIPSAALPLYSVTGKNAWFVVHDGGNESITDWDQFETIFVGCQRIIPEKPGRLILGSGYDIEIELYDIARVLMEDITMKMVCAEVVKQATGPSGYTIFYDLVYQDADSDWVAVTNQQNNGTAYVYPLAYLFAMMQYLCQQYYYKLRRGQFSDAIELTVNFAKGLGDQDVSIENAKAGLGGSPYTHLTFYPQNYQDDMLRGTPALGYDQLLFIGEIKEGGTSVAGLLVEQKDDADTFATARTMWEFLKAMCESTFCQATIRQRNKTQIGINFHGVLESTVAVDEAGTPRSITLADLDAPDYDEGQVIDIAESAGIIANASVSMKTTGSADITNYEQRSMGTAIDKGFTAELVLHNLPTMGEGRTDGIFGDTQGLGGVGVRRKIFPWYNLFYLDDPGGQSVRPIRVSHDGDIRVSATESYSTAHETVIELPLQTDVTSELFAPPGRTANIEPIIAPYTVVQQEGGLMRHVARLYTTVFGNRQQARYRLRLLTSQASYADIGSHFRFSPVDSNGNYSGQALIDPARANLGNLYGRCVVLRIKPFLAFGDEENGTPYPVSEVTLLGIAYS